MTTNSNQNVSRQSRVKQVKENAVFAAINEHKKREKSGIFAL